MIATGDRPPRRPVRPRRVRVLYGREIETRFSYPRPSRVGCVCLLLVLVFVAVPWWLGVLYLFGAL